MSDIMRPRYGTKAENDGYIGLDGEISIDRETQHLRIHDGVTAGGAKVVANQDEVKVIQDGLQGLQKAVGSIDVGVTSFNGSKGAVTYSAPVSSVNGKTGAVTVDVGVTSVNGQTGAVTISVPAAPKAYITETWQSGKNWYRKYSDGWIEQGGYISAVTSDVMTTVSFNTQFVSPPLIVKKSVVTTSSSTNPSARFYGVNSVTSTNFATLNTSTTYMSGFYWEAKGY